MDKEPVGCNGRDIGVRWIKSLLDVGREIGGRWTKSLLNEMGERLE